MVFNQSLNEALSNSLSVSLSNDLLSTCRFQHQPFSAELNAITSEVHTDPPQHLKCSVKFCVMITSAGGLMGKECMLKISTKAHFETTGPDNMGSFSWIYYNSCNSLSCRLQEGSAASQKLPNTLRNVLRNVAPTSLLECFEVLILLLRLKYCSDLYSYAKLSTYQACETWFFSFSLFHLFQTGFTITWSISDDCSSIVCLELKVMFSAN